MRGIKILLSTTALLAGLAVAPAAQAQISINIGVQPVCSYGYYGYAPYACAPMGFYGPGYFYNGIFLGMGPWGGWGYSHGWGGHRFSGEGGGNYHGGPGPASYRSNGGGAARGGGGQVHSSAAVSHGGPRPSAGHATVARTSAPRAEASHASAPAAHSGGGGGGARGGGGGSHGGGGGGGQHR
jgi:hypothetical protein